MKIEPAHFKEAYRCAKEVRDGKMRLVEAKNHLASIGLGSGSAGNYVVNFKHMRAGRVYKRAMSVASTEYFLKGIAADYGNEGLAKAVKALKAHIQYYGRTLNKHSALAAKYETRAEQSQSTMPHALPPEVRLLPMSADDSTDMSIEEMQKDYFLADLPYREGGEYRCNNCLNSPAGSAVLFQYRGHVVATATLNGKRKYKRPDADGYTGANILEAGTIRVFQPISSESVQRIWPKFERFSRVKQFLDPKSYPAFLAALRLVRAPMLGPEEGDQENSSRHKAYLPNGDDSRELVLRQIRARRGQSQFRDALRSRYGDNCVVTGCQILDIVEAAHITPYRGENDNNPENGLLLRADIHTLFDLNLLGIEPHRLIIRVHPKVAGEYGHLNGKQLVRLGKQRPSQEALELRFNIYSGSASADKR